MHNLTQISGKMFVFLLLALAGVDVHCLHLICETGVFQCKHCSLISPGCVGQPTSCSTVRLCSLSHACVCFSRKQGFGIERSDAACCSLVLALSWMKAGAGT